MRTMVNIRVPEELRQKFREALEQDPTKPTMTQKLLECMQKEVKAAERRQSAMKRAKK